jgi:hypothetical protein
MIRRVHAALRGTCGERRVFADLRLLERRTTGFKTVGGASTRR